MNLRNILNKLYSKEILNIFDDESYETEENYSKDSIFLSLMNSNRNVRIKGWKKLKESLDDFLKEPLA